MKALIIVIVLIIAAGVGFAMWQPQGIPQETIEERSEDIQASDASVVTDGTYLVNTSESNVNWSGKKPLIDGYTNSGTIALTEGSIDVAGDQATGSFVMDMNTINVGLTATKPGQEGKLEEHLKGERWFDVAQYPTATFAITSVTPRSDSDTTFIYDVTGNLTMKGETHELSFPATIYSDEVGTLIAQADFEFDRTKWGITSGSSSFFDDLADNAISDMVALSFELRAQKQ